ncbi:MAG: nitroreductase family protein [bacterium]|nr:nitroreductase family protein [bacterium]MDT8284456.1 nitroreductase family protein [Thermovirgaceae bacterium]
MLRELVERNRSYRRFDESRKIGEDLLRELVDLARMAPSRANLQPLKYILSFKPETNDLIFPHLAWAGYLKDWPGPGKGERPAAYIVILRDTVISTAELCDHGIAAQTILLGAAERGLGGVMMDNIDRDLLLKALKVPSHLKILLVLALGKPVEDVRMDPVGADGDMKYWRDEEGVHHVPKRSLEEIIVK